MPVIISRVAGRRRELLPRWNLPIPPEAGEGEPLTLRALLSRIVRTEVAAIRIRQKQQKYVTVLTEEEIREAAKKGRVLSGASEIGQQEVDEEQAVGAALQAFEDGMYLVLIDDIEQKKLDQQVHVTEESAITFIRLTFLGGG